MATLILLPYAKLLHTIIDALLVAKLEHLNGTSELVWLVDGNVTYLGKSHVFLFIMTLVILLVGLVFSFLLFFWQWLLRCHTDKKPFRWIRNTKLNSFMDAYCAPYKAKQRYWTGLLLFTRVLLYLSLSISTADNDPRVTLVSIIFVVGTIIVMLAIFKVYRKWPLFVLELSFHLNLNILAVTVLYEQSNQGNKVNTPGYVSLNIAFITFLAIIVYHAFEYIEFLNKCLKRLLTKVPKKQTHFITTNTESVNDNGTQSYDGTNLREPLIDSDIGDDNKHEQIQAELQVKKSTSPTYSVVDAPRKGGMPIELQERN